MVCPFVMAYLEYVLSLSFSPFDEGPSSLDCYNTFYFHIQHVRASTTKLGTSRVQAWRHNVHLCSCSSTCPSTVWQSLASHHDSICDPQVVDFSSYRGIPAEYDRPTFSVSGLSVWNSLSDILHNSDINQDRKAHLFSTYSALEVLRWSAV